jgi:hypothetical protein
MAFTGLIGETLWTRMFKRSADLRPGVFSKLIATDVVLPLSRERGAIVADTSNRFWLCEQTLVQTLFVSFGRTQGMMLTPIYGPWEGRRPDMIALNEFERTMIEVLENPDNKRRAAA